jgi:YD repeat-containing protein
MTYPSGRVITYTSNAAGRLISAVDTANSVNYALAANYAPQGALQSVTLGQSASFTGIGLTHGFNARLQPTTMQASPTNGTVLDLTYGFNYGTANNGNVASVLNNRNHNRDLSYTYDQLNRIATAQSAATSGSDCWGLSFGYDI